MTGEDANPGDGIPPEIAGRIRRRGGTATIYDIADLAGVNPSTVSRALGKPGRVSQPTEARIRAAADQLDFHVNPMARALPTGRSHTLGLMVADITNPVIFDIVRGAEQAAAAEGYILVIAESQESGATEEEAATRLLLSVDGLILATTRLPDERIAALAQRKPVVLLNRLVPGVSGVLPDVETGVGELITHLADHGHRSLVYLSGPPTSWISKRRWRVMAELAEARGIALVEIGPLPPTIDGGRDALHRVRVSRATAAIAFNDLMAIGLIQAATATGLAVPGELSIAGFDDIFGSELIVPALTTVRAQLELAGQRAVNRLLQALADTQDDSEDHPLATTLVVRGSTGPAPV